MKRSNRILIALLAVVITASFTFTSCKNKTDCTGRVIITMVSSSGERVPVPDCKVVFGDPSFASNVYREVTTDENGMYEGVWQYEAYLKVVATKTIDNRAYKGSSSIRLSAGEITEQEILLKIAQ